MLSGLLACNLLFHFVIAPFVNMREFPDESSEIVSQAYFSEEVIVVEETPEWMKIETAIDHYQGWIKLGNICGSDVKPANTAKVNRSAAHLYHVTDTVFGPVITLPFESVLQVIDEVDSRWIRVALPDQRELFVQRGDVTFDTEPLKRDQLAAFSLNFLGLPYTWGGRSSFGYDCSGFVQMLYRQMGVFLPRDSKDQARWEGFKAIAIEDMTPGDLVFFGYDENRIRHVGMYLGEGKFINSTIGENAPYIHISRLSDPDWNGSGKWTYSTARTLK